MVTSGEFATGELQIGVYLVKPGENSIMWEGNASYVEPKVMHVLCMLAAGKGNAVSRLDLLENVWSGVTVSDGVLSRVISILRATFRKYDPNTEYVKTIPKHGYILAQPVVWVGAISQSSTSLTESQQAHQLYQQGKSLNARINGDTIIPVARDLLEQSLEIDPNFAEAHAEIAHSYTLMGTYIRRAAGPDLLEKAVFHAERSIALKPNLAFPRILLAIAEFTDGNMLRAIELNEEAVKLEPDNAEVVMRLGYFYTGIGLVRLAIPILEKAVALDPAQGRNLQVLALAKMCNGNLEEADQLAKRAIELHHYFAYDTYAGIAVAMGKHDLAMERIIAGRQWMITMFDDKFDENAWEMAARMAFSPVREERMQFAKALMNLLGNDSQTPEVPLLQGLLRCGAAELYFETMGNCLPVGRHGSYLSMWADTEPCRDIYQHPDFLRFAEKVGMRTAWDKYGWPDRLVESQ